MSTKVVVEVKAKHIAQGRRQDPRSCPVALAAKEMGLQEPHMNISGRLTVWNDSYGCTVYVNAEAGVFACRFDDGKTVKPASFEFEASA